MRLIPLTRAGVFVALAAACLILQATPSRAQQSHDCGNGVSLRLSAPVAAQGGLLQAEVRTGSTLAEVSGEWSGHATHFWADDKNPKVHHALIGIDLERAPGRYELTLTARSSKDQTTHCSATVVVRAGQFAIEKLQVPDKFVELSKEDLERSNQERQRLREIFARVTPERMWTGRFRVPLDGVETGTNFGRRRILNGQPRSPHTGVDFHAAAGTPVHAAQRGRVMVAEEMFFSGNTVVLDHGFGIYTFYGHMESLAVRVGDIVDDGAILGKVGATGRATGPHLHWALTVSEARVNPLSLIALPHN
ncbi:MAG: M23 family metallopeptidase [Candidatus Acidiferrales bacterium]